MSEPDPFCWYQAKSRGWTLYAMPVVPSSLCLQSRSIRVSTNTGLLSPITALFFVENVQVSPVIVATYGCWREHWYYIDGC